jgi:hypothetical protein
MYRETLHPNIWEHDFVITVRVSIILKWISYQSELDRGMAVNLADSGKSHPMKCSGRDKKAHFELEFTMKIAAAKTIAELVSDKELRPEYIIPRGMDFKVPPAVAAAVARAAMKTGVARIEIDSERIAQRTHTLIYEGEPGYHKEDGITR